MENPKERINALMLLLSVITLSLTLHVTVERVTLSNALDELNMERGNTVGRYYDDKDLIIIYTNNHGIRDLQKTAIHELMHVVWYEYLTYDQLQEYHDIVAKTEFWITEYSKESVAEDFAEHAAHWALGWEIDPEREEFFNKTIRKKLYIVEN